MPGSAIPRRLDEPIAVSPENLVPANNFYRHLEANLDLSFVREWARELYSDWGCFDTWLSLMRPHSALGHSRSSAVATGCRAVAFRTADAHGLYGQLGFLPADETVMQRPRPG